MDDVLSISNPDFENYLGQMYPAELEIKDTTESNASASYLSLLLSIGRYGQLRTSLNDKRDDFWIWLHGLKEIFVKEKCHYVIFPAMALGSHFWQTGIDHVT